MKRSGRYVCLIMSMLLFIGCGRQDIEQNVQIKENIATEEKEVVEIEEGTLYATYQTSFVGDELLEMKCLPTENAVFIAGVRQGADGFSAETVVYRLEEGSEAAECAVYEQEKLLSWCSDEQGKIDLLSVKTDADTLSKEYFLHTLTNTGEKEQSYSLQNIFANEQNFGSFSTMSVDEAEICVTDETARKIYVFDYEADSMKQKYDMELLPEYLDCSEGKFYGISRGGDVNVFEPSTGSRQEKAAGIWESMGQVYDCITDGKTVWGAMEDGVYSVNPESGKREEIIKYLNYDILPRDYMKIYADNEANVWKLVTWSQMGEQVEVFSLKPAAGGEKKTQKEDITLSIFGADTQLQELVIAFNKSSDKYRVEIVTAEADTTYQEFGDKEQIQLTTGKGPDIFTKTGNMIFSNYIEKGIVEDLAPYIERDLEVGDYVESSLYAYERDGKVYAIEPSFILNLMVAKKELVGDVGNWTFREMAGIMKENPEITGLSDYADATEILRICIGFGGIAAYDYDAIRECILFAEQYGKGIQEGEYAVLGENVLVKEVQINDALDWADIQMLYGKDIVPVGYPRDSREGVRHSSVGWSINANSKNKEGAWEFIKFMLSENYQRQQKYGFSPLKKIFEEQLETYLLPMSYDMYIPEAGGIVSITNLYSLPSSGGKIEHMTEEQIATIKKLVEESDSFTLDMDYQAWSIILEEATAYFSEQKGIDDVMNNIENRINLYLEEKK